MKTIQTSHILVIVLLTLILTSCQEFGIEVTTVKGEWQSKTLVNQYVILNISDNEMFYNTYKDGQVIKSGSGTWTLDKDTLSLYQQSVKSGGMRRFKIEKMTMNTLTLRNLTNDNVWIMTRVYPTDKNDYDSRFLYVSDLKKGFLWYAWEIIKIIFFIFVYLLIISFIFGIMLPWLWEIGKRIINKIIKRDNK
ncbi:MAG: hypothetical protein HDS25_00155 [Bacteroides sp.]|nr:hypothetical protein [Bacteroides sp.]